MTSPRDPPALPAPDGGEKRDGRDGRDELQKIFESFGLRVVVDEGDEGDDSYDLVPYSPGKITYKELALNNAKRTGQLVNGVLNDVPSLKDIVPLVKTSIFEILDIFVVNFVCGFNPFNPKSLKETFIWSLPSSDFYRLTRNDYLDNQKKKIDQSWFPQFMSGTEEKIERAENMQAHIHALSLGMCLLKTLVYLSILKSLKGGGVKGLLSDINEARGDFSIVKKLTCKGEDGHTVFSHSVIYMATNTIAAGVFTYAISDYLNFSSEVLEHSGFSVFGSNIQYAKNTVYAAVAWNKISFEALKEGIVAVARGFSLISSGPDATCSLCAEGIENDHVERINEFFAPFVENDYRNEYADAVAELVFELFLWIPYVSKATTQDGKTTYDSIHGYFSSTGRENAAAEAFLDALNAWNTLSDNNKLSPHECPSGRCSASAPITVRDRKHAVDRPEDLGMVRRMSNVSVAYGEGTSVQHWNPLDPAEFANVAEVTDTTTESMRSAAWANIREGYARLKKGTRNRPGWYYLLTFAMALKGSGPNKKEQELLRFYEVTDREGNVATVPVLRHSPELTVEYVKNGKGMDVTNDDQALALSNMPNAALYAMSNENNRIWHSTKLLREALDKDVVTIKTYV